MAEELNNTYTQFSYLGIVDNELMEFATDNDYYEQLEG